MADDANDAYVSASASVDYANSSSSKLFDDQKNTSMCFYLNIINHDRLFYASYVFQAFGEVFMTKNSCTLIASMRHSA